MTRIKRNLHAVRAVMTGAVALVIVFALWTGRANTLERVAGKNKSIVKRPPAPPETAASVERLTVATSAGQETKEHDDPCLLNAPQQYALGMIETGNDDRAVGGAGEVSRYQMMPMVWRRYSASRDYQNPALSREIAAKHWMHLHDYFKKKTHREPTDFDMYVLWNTRQGYYARKGFDPKRLHRVVRDRAQRFCNLVELAENRTTGTTGGKRA